MAMSASTSLLITSAIRLPRLVSPVNVSARSPIRSNCASPITSVSEDAADVPNANITTIAGNKGFIVIPPMVNGKWSMVYGQ